MMPALSWSYSNIDGLSYSSKEVDVLFEMFANVHEVMTCTFHVSQR